MYKNLTEEQVKVIREKWAEKYGEGRFEEYYSLEEILEHTLSLLDSHLGRAMEERSKGIVDECIAIVVNNSIPSNDQMTIVREIRKLLSALTPPKGE